MKVEKAEFVCLSHDWWVSTLIGIPIGKYSLDEFKSKLEDPEFIDECKQLKKINIKEVNELHVRICSRCGTQEMYIGQYPNGKWVSLEDNDFKDFSQGLNLN